MVRVRLRPSRHTIGNQGKVVIFLTVAHKNDSTSPNLCEHKYVFAQLGQTLLRLASWLSGPWKYTVGGRSSDTDVHVVGN